MESPTLPAQRKATRPRADALRNRERIVTAAREMLTEFGPEVPLDEIARRAGVGNATVYRHFPDRQALVREVVCSVLDRTARAGREALDEDGDPFAALERFVHVTADERVSALCPMLSESFDEDHPDLAAASGRVEEIVTELMDRAKAAGQLRGDVGSGDVMIAVSQLSRPPAGTGCVVADRFVHRHLQLFLDGLRASAASTLPGSPMTIEELRRP
ncbi:TetR/AcrR family transcriptional regulator [Streptomyces sp. V2]|uniref:TetR/AcrR family transcriptional regulator n=1 Tax=Streptomyces niveiscabiei TaxID=164115 RepID=A0ABW9HIG0_9ACTN|nr:MULTISPECIES: TetR/AcrR family transcriptional regulator [Streptomyces]PWG07418.1 TetR/AcrR family transcriptional regulator [Streptomyces sp. V2]QZZ28390.1 TetR/AcrR family transcriptional regulator [Streptomyces sp. ST1015]